MRCTGEGAAEVALRKGQRELCPLLKDCSISFNQEPTWVWRHGGPLWCLAQMLLGHFQLKLVGSKGLLKGWHGMHSFCFPCWLLFLAEPDLSQCKRQSWFFPKYKFPYNAWLLQWEITAASASSSCWNVMMIPSCCTYLVVALYLKIVNTWLFSSEDFGNPGLVGYLSFLLLHTQK